ncbi:MAG: HEAT repeat domain-containing protein [Planctomycetota bacterium]|nr:HEAT repeat domain-containing protein [Planctomycetota bacterium]
MRMTKALIPALLMVLVAAAAVQAAEPDVQALLREFRGQAEAVKRMPAQCQEAYAAAVAALLPDLGADDVGKRDNAQGTLEAMTHFAGRPGNEALRDGLVKALAAKLSPTPPEAASVWMLRMLQHIGRAECVPAVARLLNDKEAQIRESARRALLKNPSDEAGATLRTAMDKASDPAWHAAIINAVGERRDAAATASLIIALGHKDADVAVAAARALGKVGGADAAKALADARKLATVRMRFILTDAILLCADQMVAAGKKDDAAAIYQSLYVPAEPKGIRIAALRGLIASAGPKAVPLLTEILSGNDVPMQAVAVDLTKGLPGSDATKTLAALLPKVSASGKVALLSALGARGDAAAKPVVLEAMASGDAAVSAAAVNAMGGLGDASDVPTLAKMAAGGPATDKNVALGAIIRLGGKGVDAAIVKAMDGADAKGKAVLLRALAARKAEGVTADVAKAAADKDPAVRAEALAALGVLGDEKTLPTLVGILGKAETDPDREAAEKALTAIIARAADKPACADPVLTGLSGAGVPVRCALLRILGRVGGPKALEAVRTAAKDANTDVQDTAVRSMADWPDGGPVADLLAIAKSGAKATHQVLALRGYVRLAGIGDRPSAEKVAMYKEAMAAAKRPDEKKVVLAGMADAPSLETLEMAKSYLGDEALKSEAAAAAVKVAVAISGAYKDQAREVLESLIEKVTDANLKRQAQAALNEMDKGEDFITAWLVSGPYMEKDKDGAALFDIVLPPEKGDGAGTKWKPAATNNGVVDLGQVTEPGDNRVAYLRTYVISPKAQDVRLEVGSDDGVRVWLNGKVVHANNANRGFEANQDMVKMSLNDGVNVLLLKITNGGDGWQAAARIRESNGAKIKGLQFRPAAP